ncbi:MAG: hypothetical protein PHV43_03080 [Candidatus Colwellbacteria bacterium]|nr:hypothetical protein [Candidatus Colwellbacteria bacterium]
MKESFSDDLLLYSEEEEQQQKKQKPKRLKQTLIEGAQKQETNLVTQQWIYDLQKRKTGVLDKLRKEFECISDLDCQPEQIEGGRPVLYDEARGTLFVEMDDGKRIELSLGCLLTDGDWGVEYHLDPATVPQEIRERYASARAQRQIDQITDKQILINEIGSHRTRSELKDTYRRIDKSDPLGLDYDPETGRVSGGLVAEHMAKNFLKVLSIDGLVDFRIDEVDVYEDVALQIDFVLSRRGHNRGVGLEPDEAMTEVGIQFTIRSGADKKLARKRLGLERVKEGLKEETPEKDLIRLDDCILVSVPIEGAADSFRSWVEEGRRPGGPTLNAEARKQIFEAVLAGMMSEQEIDELWEKIEPKLAS